MDTDDVDRWEPHVGVRKLDRLEDSVSMLRLVDKDEGYDPMGGF